MSVNLRDRLVIVRVLPQQIGALDGVTHLDLQHLRDAEHHRYDQRDSAETRASTVAQSTNCTKQSIDHTVATTGLPVGPQNLLHIFGLRKERENNGRQKHIGGKQNQRPEPAEKRETLHGRNRRNHDQE